ncbi:MAG TPA: DUF3857 domain-containing protein [Chitinophagaceae bacterium]|nr:DUF3857 domain-containing protein [Chitinophagaceae bacterium]
MSKLLIIFIIVFFPSLFARGGGGEYAVSGIRQNLLKNANVVKRVSFSEYEIISLTKARLYEKYAITILNEAGEKYASLQKDYDKFHSIRSIEGKLFDEKGRELKSVKNKDIKDFSAVSAISLMEDTRVKIHDFYYKVYPYTVEYEIVTEFNNTFYSPDWLPQPAYKYAVEKAELLVRAPTWLVINYKSFNYGDRGPSITTEKEVKILKWTVADLPAFENEYASPDLPYLTTCVFLSPEQFEIDGYKGSFSSWKDIGLFQLQLNTGRDQLPANIRQQVHSLADAVNDTREKVRILYEFMQKNTRYISIQLGIGGWQPFEAAYVAKNSYGDCKALSNYMYSLLKEAGIKSYYTKIKAGRGETFFMPDFSTLQFNHIILCVPQEKDSIWLECTSQTLPAGYLSDFTCDRFALLVTEEGGKLVRTPKYGLKDNLEIRNLKASLEPDAALLLKATTYYTGLQQDRYHALIHNLSKDKVKEVLQEHLDFATYDISDFSYKENKASLPGIEEKLTVLVSNYATITGKRLFIIPNIMTRHNRKLAVDTERKFDIDLGFEYKDVDTVEIDLPAGYTSEAMPRDVAVSTKFGKYSSSVKLTGNKLYYYRMMEHYSGRFPASDYPELVKFYETIYKADRAKVVLVKNETDTPKGF